MIKVACCIPGSLPPETGYAPISHYETLLFGYRYLRECGFDTVETSVGFVLKLTDGERQALLDLKERGEFEIAVCNCMLPGGYSITGEDDPTRLYAYLDDAFEKVASLEIPIIVFGSGGARRIPDGADSKVCEERIFAFLRHCNALGERYGITVALEPLHKGETNWINHLTEGEAFVRALDLPHIRLLADGYHMAKEGDDPLSLAKVSDILVHAHLAEVTKRHAPGTYGGRYEIEFLQELKKSGYNGTVTCECGFRNFVEDTPATAKFMKSIVQ